MCLCLFVCLFVYVGIFNCVSVFVCLFVYVGIFTCVSVFVCLFMQFATANSLIIAFILQVL